MQLETAQLRKGLDDVKRQMKDVGDSTRTLLNFDVLKTVGNLAFEAAEKLAHFALQGAEVADEMGKMALAAGISVESFSRLAYAGKLSNLSAGEMAVAIKKLNINLSEAATAGSKQGALFRALGVDVKDAAGKARAADVVMADLADRFSRMEDGPAKAALAVQLFGKAGSQMLPFLNEGKEGLAKLALEADKFGVTLSTGTVQAATEFNDNLERIKQAAQGVSIQVAAQLAPAMAELTKQFLESKDAAGGFKGSAEVIANVLRVVASAAVIVVGEFRRLGTQLAAVAAGALALAARDFVGAKEVFEQTADDLIRINKETDAQLEAIWKKGDSSMLLPEMDFTKKIDAGKIVKDVGEATNAFKEQKKALEELVKTYVEFQKQLAEIDVAKGDMDFGVLRSSKNQGRETERRQAGFGATDVEAFLATTAGFAGFDDALKKLADETKMAANWETEAALLFKEAGITGSEASKEAARRALLLADAHRALAGGADRAATAFESAARAVAQMRLTMTKTLGGQIGLGFAGMFGNNTASGLQAAGQVGGSIAGSMGKAGSVISSAAQGAEVGGIWGALIAAIAEIVKDSEGFQKVIHAFDRDLKQLGDAIGEMFAPIGELVDAIEPLTTAISEIIKAFVGIMNQLHGVGQVGEVIKPIMEVLQKILGPIMKIIGSLMEMISSLGIFDAIIKVITPIFNVIGKVIDAVLGPVVTVLGKAFADLGRILKPIIDIIGQIGDLIGMVLAPIMALVDVVGAVVGFISGLLDSFGGLSFGIKLISTVLKATSLVILEIMNGIMTFWGGLMKGIAEIFLVLSHAFGDNQDLANVAMELQKQQFGAEAKAKEIQKKVDETIQSIADDWNPDAQHDPKDHSASGVGREFYDRLAGRTVTFSGAIEKATAAVERMTGSLTNVPAGFRYALAKFGATSTEGNTAPRDIHIHVSGGVMMTVAELAEQIRKAWSTRDFRKFGTTKP